MLTLLLVAAVAVPQHHPALNSHVNLQLKEPASSQEMLDIATVMTEQRDALIEAEKALQSAEESLANGADVIRNGLCNYMGFCAKNPANSCDQIIRQPGLEGAELPDGKYWLTPLAEDLPSGMAVPPLGRVQCLFDKGEGWTVLFDDSRTNEVKQDLVSPVVRYVRFKEVLAFTPDLLRNGGDPVRQAVYYIDESRIDQTAGKTFDELHNYPWTGQDRSGSENDDGLAYPNRQTHNRFKYLGKMQSDYASTLFILDDGDVKDDACKLELDLEKCDQEFYCGTVNGTQAVTGKVAQTSLPTTPKGIISFGCGASNDDFTQCGTCTYEGPDEDKLRLNALAIRRSVVQKFLVR
jgi:hypothetical protein